MNVAMLKCYECMSLNYVLTKTRNDLKWPEMTYNDLQWARNDLKQPTTTYNKQETTWNNLHQARNDLKWLMKDLQWARNDLVYSEKRISIQQPESVHQQFLRLGKLFSGWRFLEKFFFRRLRIKCSIQISNWFFSILGVWHPKTGPKSKNGSRNHKNGTKAGITPVCQQLQLKFFCSK